jgi:hypothetical protein
MPLPDLEKTITLEQVGAPEFSVRFRRIPAIPYEESVALQKKASQVRDTSTATVWLKALVLEWSIEDSGGRVHPLPSEDETVVGQMPSIFVEHIVAELFADATATGAFQVNLVNASGIS